MAAKGSKCNKKLEGYKQCFKKLDTDGNGSLTEDEMKKMLCDEGSHVDKKMIQEIFTFFDGPGGDKKISFEEFCKGLDKLASMLVQELKESFDAMDADKSGFLDKAELTKVLQSCGRQFSEKEIDAILKEADANGDNKISFEEFLAAAC